jgi:hypothetical protein
VGDVSKNKILNVEPTVNTVASESEMSALVLPKPAVRHDPEIVFPLMLPLQLVLQATLFEEVFLFAVTKYSISNAQFCVFYSLHPMPNLD